MNQYILYGMEVDYLLIYGLKQYKNERNIAVKTKDDVPAKKTFFFSESVILFFLIGFSTK